MQTDSYVPFAERLEPLKELVAEAEAIRRERDQVAKLLRHWTYFRRYVVTAPDKHGKPVSVASWGRSEAEAIKGSIHAGNAKAVAITPHNG